jgi:hypothetical protein
MAELKPHVSEAIRFASDPLTVSRVLGPAGGDARSASAPQIVRCHQRGPDEFVVKCACWSREPHPYLCANEWIAGLLALQCDVPALEMMVIQHPECLGVGWLRIQPAMWASVAANPTVLARLENPDACYDMVVFDALVRNADRLAKNITARRLDPRAPVYRLFVSDHDRALMPPGVRPADIGAHPELDDPRLWIRERAIRDRITDAQTLRESIRRVQDACSGRAIIVEIVNSTPEHWLPAAEKQSVIDFLADRATRLGEIVEGKARAMLPGLF